MNISCALRHLFLSLLAVVLLGCTTQAHAQGKDSTLTDAQVDEAIAKIKKFLFDAQGEDGAWYGAYHTGPNGGTEKNYWGPHAMALLALIASGESPQHPDIAKGLEILAKAEFHGVYALSMRAHVWSYLPQGTYGELLRKDADRMLRSSYGPSRFGYPLAEDGKSFDDKAGERIDNSTTQYGVLALWQASKRGVPIPKGFWADAVQNFLDQQSDFDGGWAYSGNRNVTQSMTLAGLTCMYVGQQELFRKDSKPNAKVATSIAKGLDYLDKNFNPNAGVHGGVSYMWYGYERVGLASGRKYFGQHDWFQEIAQRIVKKNGKYGNAIHTAAFDLMFLARGRVPVWITKLEIPGANWNNRPNDVYYLNRYISDYREHEVNWQAVNVDTSKPESWAGAPLMWISSDDSIAWKDNQVAKIKAYLDMGGTLIANVEGRESSARASFIDLAEKMYPDLKFEDMPRDHPMASLLEGSARGNRRPDVTMLTNGARVLMILPKDDWGMTFQSDESPNPDKNEDWRLITNIYGVATDRGELTPRLASPLVERQARATTGTIKVVIPKWNDPAGKIAENDVYAVMRNYMHNETGMKLLVEELPLADLATADPALLHLVGVNAIEMTPEERTAIGAYVQKGGTILIENLGGTGEFAKSVNDQLATVLPSTEELLKIRADVITGRVYKPGTEEKLEGTKRIRLVYRRLVLERANPEAKLLLRGYVDGDRIPAYLSYEDLSLGMLGVKQYGINGYSPETSRELMLNILLQAHVNYPGSTSATAP